jgi:fibronectin type 3 domain-containing protein
MKHALIAAFILTLASAALADFVVISWDAPTQDVHGVAVTSADIKLYRVYRKTLASSSWTTMGYTPGSVTSAVMVQTAGATQIYAVAAMTSAATESAKSSVVTQYCPVAPVPRGVAVTNWGPL